MKEILHQEILRMQMEKLQQKIAEAPDKVSADAILDERLTEVQRTIRKITRSEGNFPDPFELVRRDIIFAQNDIVTLKSLQEDMKEALCKTTFTYSAIKDAYKQDGFLDMLWREHFKPSCYYCSIHDRTTGKYLGYCGVSGCQVENWELTIELDPAACSRGYGYQSLGLFLARVREVTGQQSFFARVVPDNIRSQKLIEKLGAKPNGLGTLLMADEDILTAVEEKHLDMIDTQLTNLAMRFGVEPRKLLSHTLVYQFSY